MKKDGIHKYIWVEFAIWFVILCIIVFSIRLVRYRHLQELKTYQIFMQDVDGLIVGSPVKFMGVQVGYIQKINIVGDDVYVKFILNEKDLKIPKGAIATVEFSGLGGSKSLEIFPPTDESLSTDKLIVIHSTKRIHDSLGLLNDMFDKIGSLVARGSYFTKQLVGITPVKTELAVDSKGVEKFLTDIDKLLNKCENNRKKFQKKPKGEKE